MLEVGGLDSLANRGQDHEQIIELLPDYAVGALGEAADDDVARHLETCASCRHELRIVLQLVGVLSDTPPPSPAPRETLLARARGETASPVAPVVSPLPASQPPRLPEHKLPEGGARSAPPHWWQRTVPIAFAAAAVAAAILLTVGIVALRPNANDTNQAAIAQVIAHAPFYQLSDSDLSPPAAGVLFAMAEEPRAVLLAEGLPPLENGQRYQIWLFTREGERSSGGLFSPDAGGRAEVLLETPQPMLAYAAVAVSAEPSAGSPAPTSPLVLGGWLE